MNRALLTGSAASGAWEPRKEKYKCSCVSGVSVPRGYDESDVEVTPAGQRGCRGSCPHPPAFLLCLHLHSLP